MAVMWPAYGPGPPCPATAGAATGPAPEAPDQVQEAEDQTLPPRAPIQPNNGASVNGVAVLLRRTVVSGPEPAAPTPNTGEQQVAYLGSLVSLAGSMDSWEDVNQSTLSLNSTMTAMPASAAGIHLAESSAGAQAPSAMLPDDCIQDAMRVASTGNDMRDDSDHLHVPGTCQSAVRVMKSSLIKYIIAFVHVPEKDGRE